MDNILYSVIIPHKNTPQLLERCLNSIPKRDDIQIIIIDDNSDDIDFESFPGINRHKTEVIFSKENKGAGFARNIGLEKAKGKWILFADADDFYINNAWDVFDKYILNEFDILYFGVNCVNSETLIKEDRNLSNNKVINDFLQKKQEAELRLKYTCWEPWNKLFSKKN